MIAVSHAVTKLTATSLIPKDIVAVKEVTLPLTVNLIDGFVVAIVQSNKTLTATPPLAAWQGVSQTSKFGRALISGIGGGVGHSALNFSASFAVKADIVGIGHTLTVGTAISTIQVPIFAVSPKIFAYGQEGSGTAIVNTYYLKGIDSTDQVVYWSSQNTIDTNPTITQPQFSGSIVWAECYRKIQS